MPVHWKFWGLPFRFGLSRLGTPVKEPNKETLKVFTVGIRSQCAHILPPATYFERIWMWPHHTHPQVYRKRKWPRCFEWMRFYHADCSGTSWTSVGVDTARAALPKSGVEFQEETKKNRVNFKGVRQSKGMNRCHWLGVHSPTHIIISKMFSL